MSGELLREVKSVFEWKNTRMLIVEITGFAGKSMVQWGHYRVSGKSTVQWGHYRPAGSLGRNGDN
jgi:hypothetical protein